MAAEKKDCLIFNIRELVSCQPLAEQKQPLCRSEADLGILKQAWLLIRQGKVHAMGEGPLPAEWREPTAALPETERVDARQGLVLPGLIDSHTHPLFAGNRSHEFAQRLNGSSYQEIAAGGGGILSSVRQTRQASDGTLKNQLLRFIHDIQAFGVTTAEVKTGYGLDTKEELRQLRLIRELDATRGVTLIPSLLALHALPPEVPTHKAYADRMEHELLPQVLEEQLARYADVFIEEGYFRLSDCESFMEKAIAGGLGIRVHADEFSRSGGAAAAARWHAASADHLQFSADEDISAMAEAGVTATLLPGTSLYTGIPFTNGRRIADLNCRIAIATDFNPGSCYLKNLPMLASIAALHCGLRTWEAIAAVTAVPAYSLGLHGRKGVLMPGSDGDFLIHSAGSYHAWLADMGQRAPEEVRAGGRVVTPRVPDTQFSESHIPGHHGEL